MSSSLYWRPADRPSYPLGDDLKYALRRRFCLGSSIDAPIECGAEIIPWLEGIIDSDGQGYEEAEELIGLIKKYGSVMVWEEG